MRKQGTTGKKRIGVVINASVKLSRDFLLAFESVILNQNAATRPLESKFFLGSAATTLNHLAKFAASVDVLVFSGIPRHIIFRYAQSMPTHPPIVLCTYSPVTDDEFSRLGCSAVVIRDNEAIGRMAADFFLRRGLRNFAFCGLNGYREDIAGVIREQAFRKRLEKAAGGGIQYSSLMIGSFADNEDYWETDTEKARRWMRSLPLPCGVFVNGDHLAFRVADGCRRLGIAVPDSLEILGMNHNDGFCERSIPLISSIVLDSNVIATKTLDVALRLVDNPDSGSLHLVETVDECVIVEHGSTSFGRGYGLVAVKAKEFIQRNAWRGISVPDVAKVLGVSQRTLELRVKEATGMSVRDLIIGERMERACELLVTSDLPISRIIEEAGCPTASSVFALFKRRYGVSMSEYRKRNRGKHHG